jgi:hypothetical protein
MTSSEVLAVVGPAEKKGDRATRKQWDRDGEEEQNDATNETQVIFDWTFSFLTCFAFSVQKPRSSSETLASTFVIGLNAKAWIADEWGYINLA